MSTLQAETVALPAKAQTAAVGAAVEVADRADAVYTELLTRGRKVVGRIRRQQATQDLKRDAATTVRRTKAASTTAKKGAADTATAAKATRTTARKAAASGTRSAATANRTSAKRTTTTARKRAASTRTATKSATTSARKTTALGGRGHQGRCREGRQLTTDAASQPARPHHRRPAPDQGAGRRGR